MNQIEFIKKWAKEGDRIEDGEARHLYKEQWGQVIGYENWFRGYISEFTWQSPKIYRLVDTRLILSGYCEEWELVADYADEVKKEQENNGENTLYGIIAKELSSGKPLGNVIYTFASEVEKRLKALEERKEVKKEEELLMLRTSELFGTTTKQKDLIYELFRIKDDFDSRLKALEDKLK